MTDQLASARGHLKNARNQLDRLRHEAVHARDNERAATLKLKTQSNVQVVRGEISAALDALAEAESDDEPPGDYYVLTPEHATLGDAHGPVTEVKARGMASTLRNADNATRAKVVHRP